MIYFQVIKEKNDVDNFGDLLNNFFEPLFEVSINPSKNTTLFNFLLGVSICLFVYIVKEMLS